jgi:hypothetical protein
MVEAEDTEEREMRRKRKVKLELGRRSGFLSQRISSCSTSNTKVCLCRDPSGKKEGGENEDDLRSLLVFRRAF